MSLPAIAADRVDPEPFVDVKVAARFLGVKASWLYDQVRVNKVPSYKLGALRRFRLSELEGWALAAGRANGDQAADGPPDGAAR